MATAEESAAASEELSAQAEISIAIVAELQHLIEGGEAGVAAPGRPMALAGIRGNARPSAPSRSVA